ncbi:MAG: hypothetical protein WCD70_01870 [Alphaproteobacteria bacterium]
MKPIAFLILLFSALVLAPQAQAGSADLTLSPTRVIFDNGERYATVNIKNSGDAIGRYHIEIADTAMQPNGGVKLMDEGARGPYSAIDYISISPRSMTLNPGDYQAVRILVKNQEAMTEGEYRSALKVTMTESDVNAGTNQPKSDAAGIVLKPKLVMAIPLIIRHGASSYHVSIDSAKLEVSGGKSAQPQAHIAFSFDGTRSVVGDVKITHTDDNGKDSVLKFFPGIAIYRGIAKINIDVPLEIPEGVDIHKGKTTVSYLAQDSEGGGVLAQRDVTP